MLDTLIDANDLTDLTDLTDGGAGPRSADPTSADRTSADATSADPTSADPTSADPTSADPTSARLTSTGVDPVGGAPDTSSGGLPCWTKDPDLWFAESPVDVEAAKALCVPCPLRQACLSGALDRREPWGVWGGQLIVQGVVVPRKRPRGRPRKDAPTWDAA